MATGTTRQDFRVRRPGHCCGVRAGLARPPPPSSRPRSTPAMHTSVRKCYRRLVVVDTRRSMTDTLTPAQRSALMSRIRGVDTKPELAVRRALHAQGYRYRIHVRGLPGRPDVVFTKRRTAVFVHGCFWHRHGCSKSSDPKSHVEFWQTQVRVQRRAGPAQPGSSPSRRVADIVAWECEVEKDETLFGRLAAFLGPPRLPGASLNDGLLCGVGRPAMGR